MTQRLLLSTRMAITIQEKIIRTVDGFVHHCRQERKEDLKA